MPETDSATQLARRIVPCLDVRNGEVVKGIRFKDHRRVGGIVELASTYSEAGADELVFYDISASPEGRSVDINWITRIAEVIDIPFCVAGGIRDAASAERVLRAGADKLSINSPALENPGLIDALVNAFGQQCVVVGVDSIMGKSGWETRQYTGDPNATVSPGIATLEWLREVQERGAGEVVLNCMNQDGVRQGYDIEQLSAARAVLSIPLVASGGAGTQEHFRDVFVEADADAALAATVFHDGIISIASLKQWLKQQQVAIRNDQ